MNTKFKHIFSRSVIFIVAFILAFSVSFIHIQAADSFENSISGFPESYKPYLRALHEKHPNWVFEPMMTGLDWSASVDAQYAPNKSLVINASAYTDIFKSRELADYNADTDKYDQKDVGFVRANKLAVSYYMDPRNFLTEEGIFQFEKLSFDNSITVKEVEGVLSGTFMSNTYISYYGGEITSSKDSNGKTVYTYTVDTENKITTKKKYSQVIYEAGKKYNINPCFLASKIRNEVGSKGTSGSVSGLHSKYPGIYNFYNIGCYDGTNPVESGLYSSSTNGTYAPGNYGRPWTSPEKSIMGGAQFNAEKYINVGQYTGYLQRFNVDPSAEKAPYTHQYMTNLAGAATPAYSTYLSYKSNGIIDNKFIFSVPVYKNMPGESITGASIELADARNKTAVAALTCNVRTGPSTENSKLSVQLPSGTAVNVLETVFTDAKTFDTVIRYPFWSKIKFTVNNTSYTGYVYSNYLDNTASTTVAVGNYTPTVFKTNKAMAYNYISSDPTVAVIENDKTIKFLKAGTVTITAYDSLLNYCTMKYTVVDKLGSSAVSGIAVKNITQTGATVTFTKNSNYSSYEVYLVNSSGKLVKTATTTAGSVTFSSLSQGKKYTAYVRGVKSASGSKSYSAYSSKAFTTAVDPTPSAVSGLTAKRNTLSTVTLQWNAVDGAEKYYIYTYDKSTNKYTEIGSTSASVTKFNDVSENSIKTTYYAVRCSKTVSSIVYYSDYSPLSVYTPPAALETVKSIKQTAAAGDSVTLKWSEVSGAEGYVIYQYSSSKKSYVKLASTKSCSYKVSSLKASSAYKFKIKAYTSIYSKTLYSDYSSVFTAKTIPATASGLKLSSATSSSATLKWNTVSNADGYVVYQYSSSKKDYVKIASVTSASYTVKGLKKGYTYYFKVRAYTKVSSLTLYSAYSQKYKLTMPTAPSQVTGLAQKSTSVASYTLYWKAISGASGYQVYRYNASSKKYEKIKSTTSAQIKISSLKSGQKNKYKVRAFTKTGSGAYVYGSYSSVFEATSAPTKVEALKASGITASSYKLSWSKSTGADMYVIYKINKSSGKYEALITVTANSYTVKNLKSAQTDTYMVRAVSKTANYTAFASESTALKVKTK